jgi:hypothetical protein
MIKKELKTNSLTVSGATSPDGRGKEYHAREIPHSPHAEWSKLR